jgi:hypothetical protein
MLHEKVGQHDVLGQPNEGAYDGGTEEDDNATD